MKIRYILTVLLFGQIAGTGSAQTLVETIPLPTSTYWNSGYGMVYHDFRYWISSGSSTTGQGVFYAVDDAGNLVDTVTVANYPGMQESQGLAFDGTDFWYVDRKTARCDVFKIDQNGFVIDSITSVQLFNASNVLFGGAAWNGSGLWVSVYYPDVLSALYRIDVTTKTLIDTIPVFGIQPTGITVKGDTLFYVMDGFQADDERIYAVDLATEDTLFSFHVPEAPGVRQNPRGLAWDGIYFWLLAEPVGASPGRSLFKYELEGVGTPAINVPIRFFDYGRVRIGNMQQAIATVRNVGTADLRIDSVSILYSGQFTTSLTTPFSIPPDSSSYFSITFTPTVYGVDSCHVVLYHNDPARQPQLIRNVAMGIYPASHIVVPSSHAFGSRRVGSTNLWTLAIENRGALPFTVDSVSFGIPQFYVEPGSLPLAVDSVNSRSIRVWFRPQSQGGLSDTMRLYSNAANASVAPIALTGMGDATEVPLGGIMWEGAVPDNPFTNFDDYQPKSIKEIPDVNADGVNDVIVASENYLVTCFNGGSSVAGDVLWVYNTGTNNNNTGSVDWEDALQIRDDIDGDTVADVVFGCGGGNDFVYTLSGRTGQPIWSYGDSTNPYMGEIKGIRVERDYNGDGIRDVLVSASGEGNFDGRHAVICLNGLNGQEIFYRTLSYEFTHDVVSTETGGAIGAGNNAGPYIVQGFDSLGLPLWTYNLPGSLNATWSLREVPDINADGISDIIGSYGFSGGVFAVTANTGTPLWSTFLGSSNNGKIVLLDDFNDNGHPDFALSGPQVFYRLDVQTGTALWSRALNSSYIRGIDYLSDVNGDSVRDIAVATQQPGKIVVLDGTNGSTLFEFLFGSNIAQRGDRVVALASIDGNSSTEFVGGNREGRVVCFSGGPNSPVGVTSRTPDIPADFHLSQNYPNPFNPATSFRLSLPVASDVEIVVFDLLGRRVKTMHHEQLAPGSHVLRWDGRDDRGLAIASGVYFLRLRAEGTGGPNRQIFRSGLKLVLTK